MNNVKQLIDKWEDEVKRASEREFNHNPTERAYYGSVCKCIDELKQAHESQVEAIKREIEKHRGIIKRYMLTEKGADLFVKGLQKALDILEGKLNDKMDM